MSFETLLGCYKRVLVGLKFRECNRLLFQMRKFHHELVGISVSQLWPWNFCVQIWWFPKIGVPMGTPNHPF